MRVPRGLSADERRRGRCSSALGAVGAVGACVAALAAAGLAGCGGGAPLQDLFLVSRSGAIPGARLELRVTDDGRASCNRGPVVDISSHDLIVARQIRRDLEGGDEEGAVGPADRGTRLAPGPGAILRYVVHAEAGTVAFSDSSLRQPQVFRRIAALTRSVAKGPCHLAR
jgi:hypothetical protein